MKQQQKQTKKIRPILSALPTLVSIFAATTAVAAPTECRYANLVRSVEVVYSDPGQPVPCEVLYTKTGESITTPWRAQHEAGYCETKAEWLVDRLQSDGWQCGAADDAGAQGVEEDVVPAPDATADDTPA